MELFCDLLIMTKLFFARSEIHKFK